MKWILGFLLFTTQIFAATYSTDFLYMRQAGTDGAPSIALRSGAATGLWWPSAAELSITANGTEAARFVSGATRFPNGTAALPSMSFNSDPNTGLYSVSADRLGFSAGGSIVFSIANGAMRIGSAAPSAVNSLISARTLSGGTTVSSFYGADIISSSTTSSAFIFRSTPTVQAASFTLPTLTHFQAAPGAFGDGSTVTNQYGFRATSLLTGATNNFAFRGEIAADTGRWNLSMSGTAQNFLAGNLGIGSGKTVPAHALDVAGAIKSDTSLILEDPASGTNTITLQAPTLSGNYTLTLPVDDGAANQSLITDGSGVLSWSTPAGGGDVVGPASSADERVAIFDGTSGKAIKDSLFEIIDLLVPAGTIHAFGGTTAPQGYLLCNGSAVSRTTYATLFAVIGTAFGSGDGSTTFNLPNGQGVYLRGSGSQVINARTKTGPSLGSVREDQFQDHKHVSNANHNAHGTGGSNVPQADFTAGTTSTNTTVGGPITNGGGSPRFGSETRVNELGVNWIIKI